ncbi:hypothetical protein Tco_0591476 [Tanacetum coccineum]
MKSPITSESKTQLPGSSNKIRPPSPRSVRKEGGVFNRLSNKRTRESLTRSDSHYHSSKANAEPKVYRQETSSMRAHRPKISGYSESEAAKRSAVKTDRWAMPIRLVHTHVQLDANGNVGYSGDTITSSKGTEESNEGLMDKIQEEVPGPWRKGKLSHFSHGGSKHKAMESNPEGGNKSELQKGFKNKHRSGPEKQDWVSILTKTPKEIFGLEKGKFKAPPPMVTLAEKRDPNKYCEFHADTGHSTDECMQLRKQINEMIKAGKLSQFIKELKQNDKPKAPKKGETVGKERPLAILMVQLWERVAKQKVTQSFSPETTIYFLPLGDKDGTEGPMIIEAEIGGHFVH